MRPIVAPVVVKPAGVVLGPDYGDAEEEARQAGRGMWRGEFVEPWEWRRR